MLADEISDYPVWKTTIALKIPFIIPRTGIFVGFAFMAIYSALGIYLMLRAGPDGYADAMQRMRQNDSDEEKV